ncbi:hypothetical protein BDA99DRAFT_562612 [Phascolomyces articulosus]|uniref:Uncharacterized protein n=1 Tax=Phascolomyces articulosus TaxID=60185 RepID=A0AAD5K3Q4_9FUNG|nr:hypothetical protein BDA99DRAFT_562612 [Phascolomyces articulosus]
MLFVGLTVVFLVSLISDPPYPRPVQLASDNRSSYYSSQAANKVILTVSGGFLYQTAIWFETADTLKHGIGPMKTGAMGVIEQRRKPLSTLYNNQTTLLDDEDNKDEWTKLFQHKLQGPISKISHAPSPQREIQFAVMYHKLNNEDPQHIIRVYYLSPGANTMQYKDLIMPGTTWIKTFTLEQDSILFARDPDWYRFRIAHLPLDLTSAPHSIALSINNIQLGPRIQKYHQPKNTELHDVMLAKLHSPEEDTYRVLSFDVHKTQLRYYINITIVDSTDLPGKNDHDAPITWIQQDHYNDASRVYTGESLQYMAFVDGTSHLHQERVEVKMPSMTFTRSSDGKTMAAGYLQHTFLTWDFTSRADLLQHTDEAQFLYREDPRDPTSPILQEYYFWRDDKLEMLSDYGEDNIAGMQVNDAGTILAVWTEPANLVYIYKRDHDPHNRLKQLGWSLRMVINDLTSRPRVGTVTFWEKQEKNYMVIGLKNQKIRSYLIDASEEAEKPGFLQFFIERWNMLTVMSIVIAVFVFNESHRPSSHR